MVLKILGFLRILESKLEAGGKPSTWFPPGGLVEHIFCGVFVNFSGAFPELPGGLDKVFSCFSMTWRSLDYPGMILDRFWELHFFMKILKIFAQSGNFEWCFHHLKINRIEVMSKDSWFLFAWRWEKKYYQLKNFHRLLKLNISRGKNHQDVI